MKQEQISFQKNFKNILLRRIGLEIITDYERNFRKVRKN